MRKPWEPPNPPTPPPAPMESVLWQVAKGERCAEMRDRLHPLGYELRVSVAEAMASRRGCGRRCSALGETSGS